MKLKRIEELLGLADVIVVPVLRSGFDEPVTAAFLKPLEALKPIRKNRTSVAVLRTRVQSCPRTPARLHKFMTGRGHTGFGLLRPRPLSPDVSRPGLTFLDPINKPN